MTDQPPQPFDALQKKLERLLDPRRTMIFKPKRDTSPYASLNQRMFATTLDMLWAMFLLGPVIMQLRPMIYGAADPVSLLPHAASAEEAQRQLMQSGYMFRFMLESAISFLLIAPVLALCWSYASATPGKWALRLRIVDAHSFRKMSGQQMVRRLIGYGVVVAPMFASFWLGLLNPFYALSFLLFSAGIWWIYIDKQRRGWHDCLAGTAVVRVKHWRIRDDGTQPHIVLENQPAPEQETPAEPPQA